MISELFSSKLSFWIYIFFSKILVLRKDMYKKNEIVGRICFDSVSL